MSGIPESEKNSPQTQTVPPDETDVSQSAVEPKVLPGGLTTGSLWHAIWRMSWPLLVTTISASLIGLTDVYVGGHLGSNSQAAVGLSEHIVFMFSLFIMATGTGTTALVARNWGAGDQEKAAHFAGQSLALSITLGLCLTTIAWFVAHFALGLFTKSPEVMALGTTFLSYYSLAIIPLSIVYVSNATFNAIGSSKTTLMVVGTMTIIQITGDILTVFYNWPVPGLGVRGIALSVVTGATVGSIVALFHMSRSPVKQCLKLIFPPMLDMIRRVVNIGLPSAFQRLAWALSVFGLFFILSMTAKPTEALAAWVIGMRVEALTFMPIMALSMAVASIIGQNLGAKQVERAYSAGWRVTWIGVAMLTIAGFVLFFAAEEIAIRMSHDPNTIPHVVSYLKINALAEPFLAVGMILSGALQGAGDTRTPMYITLVCNWVIRIPTAYLLAIVCGMGPAGAWWSMVISITFMGFIAAWRFNSRAWVKQHI